MSIAYATTTIDVIRPVEAEDGYDESTDSTIATGVRAVLWEPFGDRTATSSGNASTTTRRLTCDPTAIHPGDIVISGDERYTVENVVTVLGPLTHTSALLSWREY